MDQNRNISSKLDGLFEDARRQQPVMNMNEVNDLIKNPAAHQKKSETNVIRWFGIFLLIGLTGFGAYYLFNNNFSDQEKQENAAIVTTVTPANNSVSANKTPDSKKPNELSASVNSVNDNTSSENSTIEKKEIKESSAPEKTERSEVKTTSKREIINSHYEGDATISFLSDDNRKVRMVASQANEIMELKVNDQLIPNDKYSEYKNIIEEGLKLKKASASEKGNTGNTAPTEKQNIMNAMMKELNEEGLISSGKSFDFTLTGNELILNNEKQSQETFDKFKQVYERTAGEKMPAKYNLHIRR